MGNTSGNRAVRKTLMQIYGKKCMFQEAQVEEKLRKIKGVITYEEFLKKQGRKNKGYKDGHVLTLHHLLHRSEGGETTLENGAIVTNNAHRYLHALPRWTEEVANNLMREWKINFVAMHGLDPYYAGVGYSRDIECDTSLEEAIITAYDLEDSPEEKRKYDRAKAKRNTRQLIFEEYDRDEEDSFDL